jgi:hypothetical protein
MTFVDSSVWIDYFNGGKTAQTDWLNSALGKPKHKMQAWIDARKRHRLSHAQVQMARTIQPA